MVREWLKSIENTVTALLNLLWFLNKAIASSEDIAGCSWGSWTGLSAFVQVWTSGVLQHATDLVLSSTKFIRSNFSLHQRHFSDLQQMPTYTSEPHSSLRKAHPSLCTHCPNCKPSFSAYCPFEVWEDMSGCLISDKHCRLKPSHKTWDQTCSWAQIWVCNLFALLCSISHGKYCDFHYVEMNFFQLHLQKLSLSTATPPFGMFFTLYHGLHDKNIRTDALL